MRILGIIASAVKKGFSDTFNRTTSGSLGTSSSGGVWEAIKGVWYANGTQAKSDATPSTYPIAAYNMQNQNVTIKLDTSQGVGTAFWVTDSQNWWGVFPWQDTVCTSYTTICIQYTSSCQGTSCIDQYCWAPECVSGCNGSSCIAWVPNYIGPGSYNSVCSNWSCSSWTCTSWTCSPFQWTCNAYSCTGGYASTCSQSSSACASTTGGTRYLRLIKSVTNTITTVVDQAVTAAILSIKTVLLGDTITVSAYSDAGQVTQTGSNLVNTPTSPTKGTKHGLILAPGGYSQGTTADNIDIS